MKMLIESSSSSDLHLPQIMGERPSTTPASIQTQETYHQLPQYDTSQASPSIFLANTSPSTSGEEQVTQHGISKTASSVIPTTTRGNTNSEVRQQTQKKSKTHRSYVRTGMAGSFCRKRKVRALKSIIYISLYILQP